jgi:hypothetical protein
VFIPELSGRTKLTLNILKKKDLAKCLPKGDKIPRLMLKRTRSYKGKPLAEAAA